MKSLHIITPVKDSIEFTLETVKAILDSEIKVPYTYTVYNDFSTEENTKILEESSKQLGFRLVNLSDLTDHPSPIIYWCCRWLRRKRLSRSWFVDCRIGCGGEKEYLARFV